ncbi:MAG: hypothetical protein ACI4QR_01730, partial [Eubacteriales bacterium]
GKMETQEDAAVAEGKLLSVFGKPAYSSESYEDSFDYVIKASTDDGRSVILSVYCMGVVHIGAEQQDDFSSEAANALIEYVNNAVPADFNRTVYYLDFDMQIDISLKNGRVNITQSQIPEEKAMELFKKWYN